MSDTERTKTELDPADLLVLEDPTFTPENTAIVTGAASGIGQATAVALAANGLTVVGADIDEAGLESTAQTAAEIEAPGQVHPVVTDLTDDSDVETMVEEAAERGAIQYVANIAGVQHIDSLAQFPMEKYDLLLNIMLRAPVLAARLALPHLREGDTGAIANMSSVHGHYATQDKPAYIVAKHGLQGLTRSIAAEGRGELRSFSVSVGYVLTPLMADQIEDTASERGISEEAVIEEVMLGQARTKEMMSPAEVANLFVFGFSSHGRHLNGGDLLWDGGYTTTYE